MNELNEPLHIDTEGSPTWTLFQLFLSSFCFFSVTTLFKLPIDYYFGTGWSLLTLIFYILVFVSPMIYLQLRFGSICRVGLLGVMDKYLPLGLIFSIPCFLRNLIRVIYGSAIIAHCITYIFFSLFNCDNKVCIGGTFPWSSCNDAWSEGDCQEGMKLAYRNPTAEEKFYQNFILMQTSQIVTNENFPEWFQIPALIIAPHTIGWILLFLTVIGGARIFGKILYGLIPLATALLIVVFVYVFVLYANAENQLMQFLQKFFSRFPNSVPVIQTSWDQYAFEPLIWGLLSTSAHVTISMNLFNGVYPIMGKWIGFGSKKTHLSWLLIILPFLIFVNLPILLNVALMSSSFSELYLRCHVCRDWSFPFTVAAHVFTKFATHKAIVVIYYLAILCFLLASEGLLLLTTVETIIDHLRLWHETIAKRPLMSYRLFIVLLIILSNFLSYTTIIKSGYYWIYLMDFYADRLMCMWMVGQMICFIVIYVVSKSSRLEGKLLKIFFTIFLCFVCLIISASIVWYAIDATSVPPTKDCFYEKLNLAVLPIGPSYVGLGWIIAASPIVLGLLVGLILLLIHSKKHGSKTKCSLYVLRGDRQRPVYTGGDDAEHILPEIRSQEMQKVTTLGKMHQMRDTLQSGHWPQQTNFQRSKGDSLSPSDLYVNDYSNVLFDQRQSLRRPLVTPETASSASSGGALYTKIKKNQKPVPQLHQEEDFSDSDD